MLLGLSSPRPPQNWRAESHIVRDCRLLLCGAVAAIMIPGLCVSGVPIDPRVAPKRLDEMYVVRLPGEDRPAAQCQYSAMLQAESTPDGPTVDRLLCEESGGQRFVVFGRHDGTATGDFETVLADPDSGSWIRFRVRQPKQNHRRDDEAIEAWRRRSLGNGPAGVTVRIDTDELTFDVLHEDDTDEVKSVFRGQVWRDINDRQPEIAALLGRAMAVIGSEGSGHLPFALVLGKLVGDYVMPPSVLRKAKRSVRIEVVNQRVVSLDEAPLDEDFEFPFGKWASWPDPPRLDD